MKVEKPGLLAALWVYIESPLSEKTEGEGSWILTPKGLNAGGACCIFTHLHAPVMEWFMQFPDMAFPNRHYAMSLTD